MVGTSCRDCAFAQFSGDIQDGCDFGRVDKFYRTTGKILHIHDGYEPEHIDELLAVCVGENGLTTPPKPEGSKEYFYIPDRICNRCFKADAFDGYKGDWDERAVELSRARIAVIIDIPNEATLEDVLKTAKSVDGQSLRSVKLVFALTKEAAVKIPALMEKVKCLSESLNWAIELLSDGAAKFLDRVDFAANKLNANEVNYYVATTAGEDISRRYLEAIDYLLNEELERFLVVEPDADGTYVAQVKIHQALGGNAEVETEGGVRYLHITEKVGFASREDKQEYMYRNFNLVSDTVERLNRLGQNR